MDYFLPVFQSIICSWLPSYPYMPYSLPILSLFFDSLLPDKLYKLWNATLCILFLTVPLSSVQTLFFLIHPSTITGLFCYMLPVVYIFCIVYTNMFDNIWWNIISTSWSTQCISCQGIWCNNVYVFYKHLLDPYICRRFFYYKCFYFLLIHIFVYYNYLYLLLLLLFFISFLQICFIIFNSILCKMFVVFHFWLVVFSCVTKRYVL